MCRLIAWFSNLFFALVLRYWFGGACIYILVQITVDGTGNDEFREYHTMAGFLIQVRDDSSGRFVGRLSNVPDVSKHACNTRSAVTHTDSGQKSVEGLQFIWEPVAGEVQVPISVRV